MILVYILLTIIAVGVLLISEQGKLLLRSIGLLSVVAGLVFIIFILIVWGIVFVQTDWFKNIFPWIFLSLMILFWTYWLLGNLRNIIESIKKSWVEKRDYTIFVIILVLIVVFTFVLPVWIGLINQ